MSAALDVVLEVGDVTEATADVVLFKFAQRLYGAAGVAARRLEVVGVPPAQVEVMPGEHRFLESHGALGSPLALFIGTVRLGEFGYHEIRQFAPRALKALESKPGIKHVASTVHGPNYGLDEDEAVLAFVGGLIEAFQRGSGPKGLERFTVVEQDERRALRLRRALERGLGGTPGVEPLPGGGFRVRRERGFVQAPPMASAGMVSMTKPHAFVAMPFTPELEDTFHYGIQGPVKAAGMLCERVDQAVFDGPIIQRIKERIDTAKVVIADLSLANPNVYLEVGYAWGKGRPTLLLVRDVRELRFDVASYRCIVYRNIRELETLLTRELERLDAVRVTG
ncbi:nucleoside 2-deoxyribosyltransferase [Myxococcus sp. K38C18041901]|uniref:nucleoside 2-deoxyribosyltransferase n=1 Tax=Myxococcus guangdongensis TaxID=2906760 RepID=UPI0020A7322C|nr:nucleoside 2-deoxyribosyltransferase [Myxococcus guangdongensis]MCP3064926.1 nucleoside 2-deoxyribosyltransferase [Myxococcus guangdongensis]